MLDDQADSSIPVNTAEAVAFFTSLFHNAGGWSRGKPGGEMSKAERFALYARIESQPDFGWLAEMLNSEMIYSQKEVPNNHTWLFACRFWPQYDDREVEHEPNGYITLPFDGANNIDGGQFYLQSNPGEDWKRLSLPALLAEYHNKFMY